MVEDFSNYGPGSLGLGGADSLMSSTEIARLYEKAMEDEGPFYDDEGAALYLRVTHEALVALEASGNGPLWMAAGSYEGDWFAVYSQDQLDEFLRH